MVFKSKIVAITASAVAIASLALVPLAGEAMPVQLSATVANETSITSVSNATTSTWDGSAVQAVAFNVTVSSNDASGYTLQFISLSPTYLLTGTAHPLTTVPYTITDTDTHAAYAYNTINGTYIPVDVTPVVHHFAMGLAAPGVYVSDTYTDTLTAQVNAL